MALTRYRRHVHNQVRAAQWPATAAYEFRQSPVTPEQARTM